MGTFKYVHFFYQGLSILGGGDRGGGGGQLILALLVTGWQGGVAKLFAFFWSFHLCFFELHRRSLITHCLRSSELLLFFRWIIPWQFFVTHFGVNLGTWVVGCSHIDCNLRILVLMTYTTCAQPVDFAMKRRAQQAIKETLNGFVVGIDEIATSEKDISGVGCSCKLKRKCTWGLLFLTRGRKQYRGFNGFWTKKPHLDYF